MGLIRFHYNKEQYTQSLQKFLIYKNADVEIIQMLKAEEVEKAIRLVHSIKGVAVNFSLDLLSVSAHNLNEKISSDKNDIKEEIKIFTYNLSKTMGYIQSGELFKE